MTDEELVNAVEDKVLSALPEEAIDQLVKLSEQEGNHEYEMSVIMRRYNVDPVAIAAELKGANA